MENTGSDQDGNETRVYWFKNKRGDETVRGETKESSLEERIPQRMM